ncbi:autotransporter domain-containing protein, partial [Bombella sp. TMW 2.2543]
KSALAGLLNQTGTAKLTDSSVGNVINKAGFTLTNNALNGTLDNEGTADIEGSKVTGLTTNNKTLTVNKSALAELANQAGTAELTDSSVGNVTNTHGASLTATRDALASATNNGTMTLSNSTVSGDVTQKDGGLTLDNSTIQKTLTANGGLFTITGNSSKVGSLAGTANGTLNSTLTLTNAKDSYAGSMSGTGGLTLSDGQATLTGANSYTGTTTLDNGVLALAQKGSIDQSALVDIKDGARFDISGTDTGASVKDIGGTGDITLGNQTLTLTDAKPDTVYAGVISGAGGLTVAGGHETLTGNNSFNGDTTITAPAALTLNGSLAGALNNAGTTDIEGGHVAGLTTNSGTLTATGGTLAAIINKAGTAELTNSTATDISNEAGATFTATGGTLASATNSGTMTLGRGNIVTGNVTQNDGSLTLDGNQVDGTLAANGGTFNVTDAGSVVKSLSGNADGKLGGTLNLTNAADTYNGSLSGNGSLTLSNGHEVLTNQSALGGAVNVDNGTLEVTGPLAELTTGKGLKIGATGAGTLTLANGADLQSSGPIVFAKASPATGNGFNATLNVLDGGTLVAGDANGQAGLNAEEGSKARLVLNGGTLQNRQGSDLTSNLNTSIGSQGAVFDVQDQNKMTLGSGSTLADASDDADQLSNHLGDSNTLTKTGTGTFFFEGNGSDFTGPTDIEAGEMVVEGDLSHSAMAVRQNATLAGTGTVGTTAVDSGATLAPGHYEANNLGTLHVAGDLTMAKGSVLRIRGTSATTGQQLQETSGFNYNALTSDHVAVSGKATIQGGTLDLHVQNAGAGLTYGEAYRVLTATDGVTGHYDALNTNLAAEYAYLDPALAYTGNDVDIVLRRSIQGFGSVGGTRNQITTGNGLDHISQNDALADAMVQLTRTQAKQALDNLSGELHASIRTALIQDSFYMRNAVLNRLANVDCDYGRNGQSVYDLKTHEKNGACYSDHATMWGQAYGGLGHNSGDGNAALMHHNTAGFIMGADAPVRGSNWRVGGMLSYGHSQFNVARGRSSSGNSNNITVGGYAGTHWGRLNLRLGAAYSWNVINTRRHIAVGEYGGRVSSSYLGGTAQSFAELGYKLHGANSVFEPFMNVAYVNMQTNSYREHGNSAALHSRGTDSGVTFSTFGFRASTKVSIGKMVFMPHIMGAYRHGFGQLGSHMHEAFVSTGNSSDMDVGGVLLSSNAAIIDTGLTAKLTDRIDLDLSYIGQYGNQSTESGATGSFRMQF